MGRRHPRHADPVVGQADRPGLRLAERPRTLGLDEATDPADDPGAREQGPPAGWSPRPQAQIESGLISPTSHRESVGEMCQEFTNQNCIIHNDFTNELLANLL